MSDHYMISSVFVYGTLKPGERNHHVARWAGRFESYEAYLEGYALYQLEPESYPAMVPGGGRVYGCVLVYNDIVRALPLLDELEGLADMPPLYRRVEVVARPTDERVWTYVYNRPERLAEATFLDGGRWPLRRLAKIEP